MPFIIRNAFVFEGRGHGWKETWFSKQDTGTLDDPIVYMRGTMAPKRAKLLGAEYTLKAVECSVELDDNVPARPVIGDSAISYVDIAGFFNEGGADPALAILMKCQNSTRVKRRNTYLRGFWDSVEIDGGKYVPTNPTNPWITFMNDFTSGLLGMGSSGSRGAGWLTRTRNLGVPISSVTQNAGNNIDIVFATAVTWPQGVGQINRLSINTARQSTKLKGTWSVVPTDATHATTVDKIAIFPTTTVGWKGFTGSFAFQVITFYDDQKVTKRAPGRPLLEFRGRQAAGALG